jgi:two-component system, OmpR family, sensor histidine kinase QseC
MIRSIKTFLLINLLVSITIVVFITTSGCLFLLAHDVKRSSDYELKSLAQNIQNLKCLPHTNSSNHLQLVPISPKHVKMSQYNDPQIINTQIHKFNKTVQFEILNSQGTPILQSEQFTIKSPRQDGFSREITPNEVWKVYTTRDSTTGNTTIVAKNYRSLYAAELRVFNDLIPLIFITYPLLALLVWFFINKGLGSIQKVTNEVRKRASNNLATIDINMVPREIKPLIYELNNLFTKLDLVIQQEKRFSSDAAHELKTPLAALKTQAQVALNIVKNEAEIKALQNIIVCVNKSSHIVQQLLTLSRMVNHTISKNHETINLNKNAAIAIAEINSEAKKKNITIELINPDTPQLILGYNLGIDILFKNLLDNAIRYTQGNGTIQVIIENHSKYIILKIIDNGPGIPPELRDRVFERFYRILGNQASGSGLGLSIVKQIVQMHNAQIELTTPASGQGLEVRIIFLSN